MIVGAAGVSRGAAGRRNGDGAGRTTDADNNGAERTIRFIGLEETHNHSASLVTLDHDAAGIHINPDKANVGRMVIKTIAVLDIDAKDFAGAIGHLKVNLLANGDIDLKVGAKSTNSLRLVLSSYISAGIGLGRTVGLRRSLGGGIGFRATGSELILVAIEHHDGLCAGKGGIGGEVGLINAVHNAVGIRPVDSGEKLGRKALHIAERSGRGGLAVNALIAGVVINHRAELSTADGRVTEELIRARDSRNQDVILLRPACSVCVVDGGLHIGERGSAAHGRLAGITVENSSHLATQGFVIRAEGRGRRAVHNALINRPAISLEAQKESGTSVKSAADADTQQIDTAMQRVSRIQVSLFIRLQFLSLCCRGRPSGEFWLESCRKLSITTEKSNTTKQEGQP